MDGRPVTNIEVAQVLDDMRKTFKAYKYHLLTNNCNHFSDAFIRRLFAE